MSDLEDRLPRPPEPPEIQRRIRLTPPQWIAIPILFLAPVALALSGALGESWATAAAAAPSFDATVHYPERFRYKQLNSVTVTIRSRTLAPFDTVTVSVDTAYGNRFSTVRALPALERPYEVELAGLRPGDSRQVVIEIQAERYGAHTGDLVIAARDTARVPLRTLVLP